ncbi:hypothetical protein RclHR1_13340002 [Rhizophagus clarus]|uniref:Uncharacterized protein n=1 Tax=Rhizophagus clarus TaxID=94130 RepID=A0A2Z6R2B7_9GLOM|nr:hypothetical protein RclHR1_13340002 [Rhizophagus clarus]GES76297.1 hypothetical protein GLOIN_2v1879464 [Rhizophagus clarus]
MFVKFHILAFKVDQILSILKDIIKNDENNSSFIDHPVLIGSSAAKWHIHSFHKPNNWNLVATISQSINFINNVNSCATITDIKLIYYPGSGLKINGVFACIDESFIIFDIELASEKVDLRKLKQEIKEKYYEEESDKVKDYDKIEFENFDGDQQKPSALMILELCRDVKEKKLLPFLPSFPCIVAPLKILEALKTSHIYWSADFSKNIEDLHLLRVFLGYNSILKTQPLCSPQRDEQIELLLKSRIKEIEIIRGVPGAHINLNMTDEGSLEHKDNFPAQGLILHNDIHEFVKYGDRPIYESLNNDEPKTWIKKSLFEKVDYQTKLNCAREEAMTVALERYLIPMISNDHETSYDLALARLCTTSTKDWFRQFVVDNYPQLSNLDKDLSSIANDIINKYSLKQKERHALMVDLETRAIFETIRPYTEEILSFDDYNNHEIKRTAIKITSPVNNDVSIAAVVTTLCHDRVEWSASVVVLPSNELEVISNKSKDSDENNKDNIENKDDDENKGDVENGDDESKGDVESNDDDKSKNDVRNDDGNDIFGNFSDSSEDIIDPLNLHPHYNSSKKKFSGLTFKHVFAIHFNCCGWESSESLCICAKSADSFAQQLEIPDFNGDLLFEYVLDYLNPTLQDDCGAWEFMKLKSEKLVSSKPHHPWYCVWNYALKNGNNIYISDDEF